MSDDSRSVIPKRLLTILVFALPPLVVAFAIVMGSHGLFAASGDTDAATATRWVGVAILMLLALDLILLVAVLGVRQLVADQEREDGES